MSKLAQLREARETKAKEATALNAKYPADQRMPAEDATKLDTLLAEVEAIDAEIQRESRLAKLAGEQTDNLLNRIRDDATRDPSKQSETSKALRAYLRGGLQALTDQQRADLHARLTPDIQAAMSTGTPAEGGYTVATEYARTL